MKQFITMKKSQEYDVYTFTGSGDWKFGPIIQLFDPFMRSGWLIEWLGDDEETIDGNECVDIRKEKGAIALYDVSDGLDEEVYISIDPDPTKRFEMSRNNFAEILYRWEELRVSRPDTILVVIHEDNHVSLETDLTIIKEYQDASYAFDINKE